MELVETLYQQGEDFGKGICVERNEAKAVVLYDKAADNVLNELLRYNEQEAYCI